LHGYYLAQPLILLAQSTFLYKVRVSIFELCIEEKKKELIAQYHFKFITQHFTGRQKQAHFLPVGKLLV